MITVNDAAASVDMRKIRKKIRLHYLLIFLCWCGAVSGISASICLFSDQPDDSFILYFTGVALIGALVFLVFSGIFQKRVEQRINEMDTLKAADARTLDAWYQSDTYYSEAIAKLEHERKTLMLLGFVILPLLLPLFIIAECNYRSQIKALGLHPGSPAFALCAFAKKQQSASIAAVLLILLASLFLFLFSAMYGFVAHSKVTSINSAARQVYSAANAYQYELEEAGENSRLQTTIFNLGSPECSSECYQRMCYYMNDIQRYNVAVICDEKGTVTGALCAKSEHLLTEYDLTHLQTFEDQRDKMNSIFHNKEVVGNYTAPPQN